MEIIKAGFKLRRRVAGTTVYFRGTQSSDGQILLQEEIATLQIGLDRPGTRYREVLGSISDAGVVVEYGWDFNMGWNPVGVQVSPGQPAAMQITVGSGFNEESDEPNILKLWSEEEGVVMEYHLICNAASEFQLRREGNIWSRRLDFSVSGPWLAGEIAKDLKQIIPRGRFVVDSTVNGTIAITYATNFDRLQEFQFVGPNANNLTAFFTQEGLYPAQGPVDIFR